MAYDSAEDTLKHIMRVRDLLGMVMRDLVLRAERHDRSKLTSAEKPIFDELTPQLAGLTYGSPEYRASLAKMQVALDHHYQHNRHHPEHFPYGIVDMNLVDLIEMFCDWKAASERHNDGDIRRSIRVNVDRFNMGTELQMIFTNTADYLFPEGGGE